MGKTIADLELQANALFEYWLLAAPPNPCATRYQLRDHPSPARCRCGTGGDPGHRRRPAPRQGGSARPGQWTRSRPGSCAATSSPTSPGRWPARIHHEPPLAHQAELTDLRAPADPAGGNAAEVPLRRPPRPRGKIDRLRDIEALSVAIPYTDAVVTDADVSIAHQHAGLDAEFRARSSRASPNSPRTSAFDTLSCPGSAPATQHRRRPRTSGTAPAAESPPPR